MSISSGMFIPIMLRWYWSRMNGYGFSLGVASGMLTAVAYKALAPEGTTEYFMFIVALSASLVGSVLGTVLSSPTDEDTLMRFYKVTRPFGAWGRFKARLHADNQKAVDAENKRDIISILMAVPWQIVFFLFMMSLIFKTWGNVAVLGVMFVALSVGLYFKWYRHLSTEVKVDEI